MVYAPVYACAGQVKGIFRVYLCLNVKHDLRKAGIICYRPVMELVYVHGKLQKKVAWAQTSNWNEDLAGSGLIDRGGTSEHLKKLTALLFIM